MIRGPRPLFGRWCHLVTPPPPTSPPRKKQSRCGVQTGFCLRPSASSVGRCVTRFRLRDSAECPTVRPWRGFGQFTAVVSSDMCRRWICGNASLRKRGEGRREFSCSFDFILFSFFVSCVFPFPYVAVTLSCFFSPTTGVNRVMSKGAAGHTPHAATEALLGCEPAR